MSRELGVAYVGLGNHCRMSHAPFLQELPQCETIGVADPAEVDLSGVRLAEDPVITKTTAS